MTHSDPDFPRFVADPGTCSFTLVNACPDPGDLDRPAPFPAAGTPQPLLPPHDCRAVSGAVGRLPLWACARCGALTPAPDGCNLGCPGAPADTITIEGVSDDGQPVRTTLAAPPPVTFPDPPPPQSFAEAWAHCRATLERLAAGDEGVYVSDALAAVEGVAEAVRAECVAVVRRLSRLHALSREELCGGIMAALDVLDLGGPPA